MTSASHSLYFPAGESYGTELALIEMEARELDAISQISGYVDANAFLHDPRGLYVDVDLRDIVKILEEQPISHVRYHYNAKELFPCQATYEWLQSNRARDIPSVIFAAQETVMLAPLKGCLFSKEGDSLCATLLFDLTVQPMKGIPLRIRRLCSKIKVVIFPTFPDSIKINPRPKLPKEIILRFSRDPTIRLVAGHDYEAEMMEAAPRARRPSLFSLVPRSSFSTKKKEAGTDLAQT
jgi:hypothetical protein